MNNHFRILNDLLESKMILEDCPKKKDDIGGHWIMDHTVGLVSK